MFIEQPLFKESREIACYYPYSDEIDSRPLIEEIWRANKNCYLPVLAEGDAKTLHFARYQPNDLLHLNRYQIYEPEDKENLSPEKFDLVILPLVGFDPEGHRLGTGGGYYDRTFSFLIGKQLKKPILIGLAYELQLVEQFPHDAWDVPLNGILTEKKWRMYDPKSNVSS